MRTPGKKGQFRRGCWRRGDGLPRVSTDLKALKRSMMTKGSAAPPAFLFSSATASASNRLWYITARFSVSLHSR